MKKKKKREKENGRGGKRKRKGRKTDTSNSKVWAVVGETVGTTEEIAVNKSVAGMCFIFEE